MNEEVLEEYETSFFLNYSQKLKLKCLYSDSKITQFYHNFLADNIFPDFKEEMFDIRQLEILSSFAIFELMHDIPDSNFSDIDSSVFTENYCSPQKSQGQWSQYSLFEKVKIVTNSMVLSFDKLFRNVVHSTLINQISSVYPGMYRLDFRGYPEIEGSLVFKENQGQKFDAQNLVGILMPGMFVNGHYREYLTIMMDFKLLVNNVAKELFPEEMKKIRESFTQNTFQRVMASLKRGVSIFNGNRDSKKNEIFNFWKNRTVRVKIFDAKEFVWIKGTGIILNKNLVITNKHLLS